MSKYATFQKIISVLVVISFLGCSTHQPIEAQRSELQNKIRHENILKISDDVKIITEDGKKYQFRITSIDENEIVGVQNKKTYRIPIDSIVVLETKEVSWGKTVLLISGIVGIVVLGVIIIAVASGPDIDLGGMSFD